MLLFRGWNLSYNIIIISVRASYTEQKYKRNTFVFAPIFHDLNSKI